MRFPSPETMLRALLFISTFYSSPLGPSGALPQLSGECCRVSRGAATYLGAGPDLQHQELCCPHVRAQSCLKLPCWLGYPRDQAGPKINSVVPLRILPMLSKGELDPGRRAPLLMAFNRTTCEVILSSLCPPPQSVCFICVLS